MKIVVTGGAGFIGSHIVDAYLERGHDVCVLDNLSTGKKEYINKKARFYEVDIRNQKEIEHIFLKEKPEIVNHHAAQMDVRKSVADPKFDADVNIMGFLTLLEQGRQSGVKKVLFASSGGAIYGDAQILPTPEDYSPHPASPYGISKLVSEYYLDYYRQAYGMTFVALRYGNVYGPRQNPHGEAGVVAIFAQKLLQNKLPIIYGDGTQTRDFIFVEDVVSANVKALVYNKSLICNIGTGVQTDINTIFNKLKHIVVSDLEKSHAAARIGEQKVSVLDCKKAKEELGWQTQSSLDQGLTQTVNFFKSS